MTRSTFALMFLMFLVSCGSGSSDGSGGRAGSIGGASGLGGVAGTAAPPRSKSNVCPDLLLLDCTDPQLPSAPLPPPDADEGAVTCEVRFRDDDGTCAQSCDPQTCTPTPDGVTCEAGPDPGVSTTIVCFGGELDCAGDGTPDASCSIDSNILVGVPDIPVGSVDCVEPADCGLEGAACVAGFCDFSALVPTLNANFYVSCPTRGAGPTRGVGGAGGAGGDGPAVTCAAVTTDGDVECDKELTVQVPCPSE